MKSFQDLYVFIVTDKFQTALMSFLSMWWKYKWTPKYRDDLSFAVFFKPRIAEEIRRYNATVSYTRRRGVCSKAAKQLGKHWSEVTYDDLSKVDLPADQMLALKAVLGAHIPVDMSECEIYLYNDHPETNIEKYRTDKYNSIDQYIDNKKPFVQCESTDEGAMTINDYVALKNWALA